MHTHTHRHREGRRKMEDSANGSYEWAERESRAGSRESRVYHIKASKLRLVIEEERAEFDSG